MSELTQQPSSKPSAPSQQPSSGPEPSAPTQQPASNPSAPTILYVVTFDEAGRLQATSQAATILRLVESGAFKEVVLFVHGWNMPPDQALLQFAMWFRGYGHACAAAHTAPGALMVGVYWPSQHRVTLWESTTFATAYALDEAHTAAAAGIEHARGRAYTPCAEESLRTLPEHAERAARHLDRLAQTYDPAAHPEGAAAAAAPSTADVALAVEAFRTAAMAAAPSTLISAAADPAAAAASPAAQQHWTPFTYREAAATSTPPLLPDARLHRPTFLDDLKTGIELLFVAHIKARAVAVGAGHPAATVNDTATGSDSPDTGLGHFLAALARQGGPGVGIHLVGHSYGATVVLAACTRAAQLLQGWQPTSLFLIEPAISRWSLAASLPAACGSVHRCGVYYNATAPVAQRPAVVAWSASDLPLSLYPTVFSHVDDIGDWRYAPASTPAHALSRTLPENTADAPNDVFGALGRFGPWGAPGDGIDSDRRTQRTASVPLEECITTRSTDPVGPGLRPWTAYEFVGVQGHWGHESIQRIGDGGPGWLEVPTIADQFARLAAFLVHLY